jgi:hypothetical protein
MKYGQKMALHGHFLRRYALCGTRRAHTKRIIQIPGVSSGFASASMHLLARTLHSRATFGLDGASSFSRLVELHDKKLNILGNRCIRLGYEHIKAHQRVREAFASAAHKWIPSFEYNFSETA